MEKYTLKKRYVGKSGDVHKKEKTYCVSRKEIASLVRKAARFYPTKSGWQNMIAKPRKLKSERADLKGAKIELNDLWVKKFNPRTGAVISIWVEIEEF